MDTITSDEIVTPALAFYPDVIHRNIDVTLKLLNGEPDRWRPHVKTAKSLRTMRHFVERGVNYFKCATTLELLTLCEAGARDVLVAFPSVGARARRIQEIAAMYPSVAVSVLIENLAHLEGFDKTRIGVFIDVNSGMNRTGVSQENPADLVCLALDLRNHGFLFRGLHYYDGHHRQQDLQERRAAAWAGYDKLLSSVSAIENSGVAVQEIVTSGTPSFPCALEYPFFREASFAHRFSPGTVVYNDLTSLSQLPSEWGYDYAAVVLTTVVSQPSPDRVTCDAGHKAVSADSGFPNCAVRDWPGLVPLSASEEHLPIQITPGARQPKIGDILALIPKHVCPTVNNFDHALLIREGRIAGIERVSARGRESPLPAAFECA